MRRVSSARSANSSRVSRSWALASARTRPSKAFRNSAVVTPPCEVCAAIDSTAANRFFSRCCISPTISFWRSVARCRSSAKPASRAPIASISSGHGSGAPSLKAMKKLPSARPSAEQTGRERMARTPWSVLSLRHNGSKRSSFSTSLLETGAPPKTAAAQVPACGGPTSTPGMPAAKLGADGITQCSKVMPPRSSTVTPAMLPGANASAMRQIFSRTSSSGASRAIISSTLTCRSSSLAACVVSGTKLPLSFRTVAPRRRRLHEAQSALAMKNGSRSPGTRPL